MQVNVHNMEEIRITCTHLPSKVGTRTPSAWNMHVKHDLPIMSKSRLHSSSPLPSSHLPRAFLLPYPALTHFTSQHQRPSPKPHLYLPSIQAAPSPTSPITRVSYIIHRHVDLSTRPQRFHRQQDQVALSRHRTTKHIPNRSGQP